MAVSSATKPLPAVYLAAGEGRRLRPLTDQLPKAMIEVGSTSLAERALASLRSAGVSKVVFDRGGYQYHGRVKAVADGAREGGLEF